MTAPLRLIVFDMDGTLIDSQRPIIASMQTAFAALNLTPPLPADIMAIVGLSLPQAVQALAPGLDDDACTAVVTAYKTEFSAMRTAGDVQAPLYDGALSVLQTLYDHPDTLLGLATGKSRRGVRHSLAEHGLSHMFATTQTADDHPSKPNPSMLQQTLSDTGAVAFHSVMVGDTSFDMEMGKAAGFATIGVTWGYHSTSVLKESGADDIVDSFFALTDVLQTYWEQKR